MFTGYMAHVPGSRTINRGISVIEDDFEVDELESWWRLLVMGKKRD